MSLEKLISFVKKSVLLPILDQVTKLVSQTRISSKQYLGFVSLSMFMLHLILLICPLHKRCMPESTTVIFTGNSSDLKRSTLCGTELSQETFKRRSRMSDEGKGSFFSPFLLKRGTGWTKGYPKPQHSNHPTPLLTPPPPLC